MKLTAHSAVCGRPRLVLLRKSKLRFGPASVEFAEKGEAELQTRRYLFIKLTARSAVCDRPRLALLRKPKFDFLHLGALAVPNPA